MLDEGKAGDPGSIWRSQPGGDVGIDLQGFMKRRTRELGSRTRWEILLSLAAALFLAAVIAGWFALAQDRLPRLGLALVLAWVAATAYRFRDRILRRSGPPADAAAATGLDYYRQELEQRRDHLRNIWVWHGPLLLACGVLILTVGGKALESGRLRNMLPFVVLLAVWTVIEIRLRRRQAAELQREIDEIERLRREPGA